MGTTRDLSTRVGSMTKMTDYLLFNTVIHDHRAQVGSQCPGQPIFSFLLYVHSLFTIQDNFTPSTLLERLTPLPHLTHRWGFCFQICRLSETDFLHVYPPNQQCTHILRTPSYYRQTSMLLHEAKPSTLALDSIPSHLVKDSVLPISYIIDPSLAVGSSYQQNASCSPILKKQKKQKNNLTPLLLPAAIPLLPHWSKTPQIALFALTASPKLLQLRPPMTSTLPNPMANSVCLLLDLGAAFDTFDHPLFLDSFSSLGFQETT